LLAEIIDKLRGHTYVFRGTDGRKLFKVRVGKELHDKVVEAAERDGIEISEFVVSAIRRLSNS
jgi:predicted HicB family RNase H-like nuclease